MEQKKTPTGAQPKEAYEAPKVLASYGKDELESALQVEGQSGGGQGSCGCGCGCGSVLVS